MYSQSGYSKIDPVGFPEYAILYQAEANSNLTTELLFTKNARLTLFHYLVNLCELCTIDFFELNTFLFSLSLNDGS